MTPLGLLRTRRFAALFWTQFLGAFNDNVFRNVLVLLVTIRSLSLLGLASEQVVALASGVFILPFLLFSGTAGELADKLPKHQLGRWLKAVEVGTMALGAFALLAEPGPLLLVALFAMGAQSAFFGPVKYGILPQLLDDDDLVGGNALVEMGTSLAILAGTLAGGVLFALGPQGPALTGAALVGLSLLGFATSLLVPATPSENSGLRVSRNPVSPTLAIVRIARENRAVYLSVLAISWFWFYGVAVLALLPAYTVDVLGGGETVITFFLALFCVGTGVGSLVCERLSGQRVELGLVPLGSIGMTGFALDLFLASPATPFGVGGQLIGVRELLAEPHGWRIAADFALLAGSCGLFVVPLYALVQQRSDPRVRSRVIAGSNVIGALFMVVASLQMAGLLALSVPLPWIVAILAVENAAVAFTVYNTIPEFLFRFVCWILSHVLYRLHTSGRDNIPQEGAVLLVCNHVSFVDWLFIAAACKRPARFVMHQDFLNIPGLGFVFRDAKVIPIASAREDAEALGAAYERIAEELADGNVVCIFPEGRLTGDGQLNPFRSGVERIVARTPVPVVPMALRGLWGSFFSRKDGAAMRRPFRRFWSRIDLVIGEPVAPGAVRAEDLGRRVAALAELPPPPTYAPATPALQ